MSQANTKEKTSTESVKCDSDFAVSPSKNAFDADFFINFKSKSSTATANFDYHFAHFRRETGVAKKLSSPGPAQNIPKGESLPRPQEKEFPIARLSVAAQIALVQLKLFCDDSGGDPSGDLVAQRTTRVVTHIRISQVKRQFRRLARLHHPDLNPQAQCQHFSELKDLRDIVLQELKSVFAEVG